jgi:hypothetical protein
MVFTDTVSLLPEELRRRAVVLSGECAWPPSDVESVIEAFRGLGVAVLGLEVWLPEGNVPRVLGQSEYDVPRKKPWAAYVDETARLALLEVKRRSVPSGAVFNLTCASEWDSGVIRRKQRQHK